MTHSLLRKKYRYVVHYEDIESGRTSTIGVIAATASVATAMAISYIEEFRDQFPQGDQGYALIPRVVSLSFWHKNKPTHIIT